MKKQKFLNIIRKVVVFLENLFHIALNKNNNISINGYKNRVKIKGESNIITVNKNCVKSSFIISGNNNIIRIEEGVIVNCRFTIKADNCRILIKKNRGISNSNIILLDNECEIKIEKNTGIGGARIVVAGSKNFINIGEWCMLSDNIEIWASDTHPIFDLQTNQRINKDKPIIVRDRCWIGTGVRILKGTVINSDSVVGMGTIVNSNIKNNTVVVDNPNRIIRENIRWSIY
ncbi:acyltransferase [Clostridium magnum]|uniref:Maltose O-acetyltransferase n=1 Tax=Clostridium magnum DSM 2767 TaxID=1121326 RepID=A0A162RD32_9CLOT|nr:hypothetical protein [Clostridium magnum]KZL89730.1 maltose O-acetyltransferase [Clostridium magnum DSM 2767]SHH65157.1 Acetyltransferase (isoleucine patch superfamily) [Clostridium magnum DSM 2767]